MTEAAGFVDPDGRGLGVVAADLDDDNRIDLYVANDMSANYLFHNLGGFRFEETAFHRGRGRQLERRLSVGHGHRLRRPRRRRPARPGRHQLLRRVDHALPQPGRRPVRGPHRRVGLAAPTRQLLGFGIAFLDANNDGRLDLISANGHVSDYAPAFPWKMPIQLLTGGPDGRLTDASARAGEPFRARSTWAAAWPRATLTTTAGSTRSSSPRTSRSSTCTTKTAQGGHWLTLRLEGVRSNRDGVGARVVVEAGDGRQSQQRFGGGSYQSAGDPRLHFGLARFARGSSGWKCGGHRGRSTGTMIWKPIVATCSARGPRRRSSCRGGIDVRTIVGHRLESEGFDACQALSRRKSAAAESRSRSERPCWP